MRLSGSMQPKNLDVSMIWYWGDNKEKIKKQVYEVNMFLFSNTPAV